MTTAAVLRLLRRYESRNVTYMAADGAWPIVWAEARGCHVRDAEGCRYLDLTAAFGVAAAGHANPAVVRAGRRQMGRLLHAMGDVHPQEVKARLARELSRLTFGRWGRSRPSTSASRVVVPSTGKVVFGNSGFEAVEAALKTARLATGRPGVLAFTGAYHGLGYGALNVTHRDHFRKPFGDQLREFGHFVEYPRCGACDCEEPTRACDSLAAIEGRVEALLRKHCIGAILVEPMQARGGMWIPAPGFLPLLRRLGDSHGALLILDEIYTGFGRTGRWFACEHSGVTPDLVCLGKGLTGGFPLSACVGRADVMDAAWPASTGEAIHTSTFLGHPVGCAMALAQIGEIRRQRLPERAARLGSGFSQDLVAAASRARHVGAVARNLGLFGGIELRRADGNPAGAEAFAVVQRLLRRGFIFLPEGAAGEVIGFTPPLTIRRTDLQRATRAVGDELAGL